ncbi:hypothetical protein [Sphingomonas sp. IC4-52]|uniref:hypothetical protein n=1 Tax=Sphingomonas sp. IC4-52 TaxID=2887202 RepID=UPI001D0FE3FC|nr:hypothetical protein [Sphingomonas sp. IC4-52]MCC2980877.1 hypothetical protein [Sphingomonas sp. IC4-52]
MAFDLRAALLKKAEVETAWLVDFEFRLRARTMRLLAARIGEDADALVARIVRGDDAAIVAELETARGLPPGALAADYRRSLAEARAQLIDEVGDPSPYRLA